MKKHALIAIVLVIAIVAAISGYYIGVLTKPPVVSEESPLPSTTPASPIQSTTPTPSSQPAWTPPERIRAAWIYVGPVGDMGWSYMHDIGRRVVEELFGDWLKTTYKESVTEAQLLSVIDELVAQGYNVIFTTSFEFMDMTIEAAKKYPDVMFFHCSGYKRAPNVGTYFADLYQVYYLNGLLAGALTKTDKIGYVAAHLIPEVVRHINAFAIGAKEVGEQLGKDIKVYVIEIGAWYDPARARQAAEVLHRQYGVDVLAFTEDSTA
ncbi:MAG: BMP family ABC transporter substrate-binding protein, partial [Desulfurococcaceae archaeon]